MHHVFQQKNLEDVKMKVAGGRLGMQWDFR